MIRIYLAVGMLAGRLFLENRARRKAYAGRHWRTVVA